MLNQAHLYTCRITILACKRLASAFRRLVLVLFVATGTSQVLAAPPGEAAAEPPQTKPEESRPALPASVDLRPRFEAWTMPPRRQGRRNTCSVFVTAGAFE